MSEFGFELRLCAHLEAEGRLVARQLGASVHRPGNRVVDVLVVEPGPAFDDRRAITPETIPHLAIEADVGTGRARSRRRAFDGLDVHPETARAVADRAVEVGFIERERRGGRDRFRQTVRYPDRWFDRLVAVENKPDLDRPGALESQLRTDVALGLVDEVVLATASHVTRAHLNRIPEAVGVWRVREPEVGAGSGSAGSVRDGVSTDVEVEVVREPTPLAVDEPGVEILDEWAGRTDVRIVGPGEKARQRRRMAERAYGKGWRTYELPGCANARAGRIADVGELPACDYHDRLVEPAAECGPACPGFSPAEPPAVDLAAERDRTSPWVAAPTGFVRRQSGLDRFG